MRIFPLLFLCLPSLGVLAAEPQDTTAERMLNLKEVVVTATVPQIDVIPAQKLSGEELKRLNSNSVADALRYFSGVQVKDYGGVGGIKTVNIRSMGTNHTGVVYDGVELGNAQNGQVDLGQFSLDNIDGISLYNGQKSEILQPAKDFGSAGSIYIRTRTPEFNGGETYHLRATLRAGSFDLLNPSALLELKLSDKVNASLSAEWINSSGKYKFRYRRVNPAGELAYDTTAVRQNGDINATRLEANLNGVVKSGQWHFKVYNYNSERGVPGAIVNNVWRRGERIWDTNSFAQVNYTQTFGKFTTLNNLKYAFYRTHYVNNDDKQIKIDNLYKQKEVYFSSANEYVLFPWWHVSAAYDFQWNTLDADVYGFAQPDRFSNMLSVATAFDLGRLKAQASVLATFIHDSLKGQQSPSDKHVLTPAAFVSYTLVRGLSARAFYKQSYRMPTFNDLYYADMGNSKLNPERVTQYNLGLLFSKRGGGLVSEMRFSGDAYYNYVKDKIVAYPKGQQFRWTMLNLGKVRIGGVESALVLDAAVRKVAVGLNLQYTFQKAYDCTDKEDSFYGDQIPYTPRHSGSVACRLDWNGWQLNYSFIYTGERYNEQENSRYNYEQPWYTHDMSLAREFVFGKTRLKLTGELNNIFNQAYEVIHNYPMPGRNFKLSARFSM